MTGNGGQVSAGRGPVLDVAFSAPSLRQPDSTGKIRKRGVDVTAWWRKHLARRVPGLYADRLGELFRWSRNRPAHQLTPGPERSAAGRFAFMAFVATICDDHAGKPALSASRDRDQGLMGTPRVPFAAQDFGQQLSESLLNTPQS